MRRNKLKILILDFLFPKNHVALYSNIIDYLSTLGNIKVVAKCDYYSEYKKDWQDIELEELPIRIDGKNMLTRKLQSLIAMVKTRKVVAENKDSYNIVLTFDTIAFALGMLFGNSDKYFILHHKNIDELDNGIKKFFFRTYMNKVNHIVFEDFFKKYLIKEIGVDEKRIHVIPHPIFRSVASSEKEIIYDCIGLSNSNDENFIKKIIDEEKKSSFLKKSNLNVVLRSKNYQFDNGNLKVISGFLPKEDYDSYIKKCKGVFVPLPEAFKYRVSGVIYDALSNYKVVIANNVPIVKEYQEKYPKLCIGVNNVNEFFEKISELRYNNLFEDDFKDFIQHHDKEAFIQKSIDAFKGACTNESKKK